MTNRSMRRWRVVTCLEAHPPVLVVELFLYDTPEHVRPRGQRDAMQQERNAHLADVRVFRVAQVPQVLDQQVLLAPDEEAAVVLGGFCKGVAVQRDYVETLQRAGENKQRSTQVRRYKTGMPTFLLFLSYEENKVACLFGDNF